VAAVPHGHWKTSTLVAGLRVDGIVAPLVIDHPMNGVTFRAYVEQRLAPTLMPNDIVVCDNLQCHKSPGVRAAIEARGGFFQCPLHSRQTGQAHPALIGAAIVFDEEFVAWHGKPGAKAALPGQPGFQPPKALG
jgi:hypothetical protein